MESFNAFKDLFDSWGYVILFIYCMGSGYLGIFAAGILSALGSMDIIISIIVAWAGNMVGSSILAILIRYQKKEFKPYINKHRRKIALMQIWLRKYGIILIFLCKYLHGIIKILVPVVIGIGRYPLKKYLFYNAISCAIWACLLGSIAFFSSVAVMNFIEEYGKYSYLLFVLVIFIAAGFYLWLDRVSNPKNA